MILGWYLGKVVVHGTYIDECVLLLQNFIPAQSQHSSQILVEEQEIKVVSVSGVSICFQSGKTGYILFHT